MQSNLLHVLLERSHPFRPLQVALWRRCMEHRWGGGGLLSNGSCLAPLGHQGRPTGEHVTSMFASQHARVDIRPCLLDHGPEVVWTAQRGCFIDGCVTPNLVSGGLWRFWGSAQHSVATVACFLLLNCWWAACKPRRSQHCAQLYTHIAAAFGMHPGGSARHSHTRATTIPTR